MPKTSNIKKCSCLVGHGNNLTVSIEACETVESVKVALHTQYSFVLSKEYLYCGNMKLDDRRSLAHYGITYGSVLRLVYLEENGNYVNYSVCLR